MAPAQKSKGKVAPKTAAGKAKKVVPSKFTLNAEKPISDGLFEIADLEKYLKERVKVDGRTNNLGEVVAIARGGPNSLTVTVQPGTPFAKRYLKYLTKKFLAKNNIKDYLRVIASDKSSYELKYYKLDEDDEEEEADE